MLEVLCRTLILFVYFEFSSCFSCGLPLSWVHDEETVGHRPEASKSPLFGNRIRIQFIRAGRSSPWNQGDHSLPGVVQAPCLLLLASIGSGMQRCCMCSLCLFRRSSMVEQSAVHKGTSAGNCGRNTGEFGGTLTSSRGQCRAKPGERHKGRLEGVETRGEEPVR